MFLTLCSPENLRYQESYLGGRILKRTSIQSRSYFYITSNFYPLILKSIFIGESSLCRRELLSRVCENVKRMTTQRITLTIFTYCVILVHRRILLSTVILYFLQELHGTCTSIRSEKIHLFMAN